MIRLFVLVLLTTSLSFGLKIQKVSDDGLSNNYYMKDDRKIFVPIKKNIVHAKVKKVILADNKNAQENNNSTQQNIEGEFASNEDFNVTKEKLNVSSEAADFFESINKDEAPVNLEN